METWDAWFAAVEAWQPVMALRASTWVYPLVSWLHLLGIGLLFGTIAVVDLRLAGGLLRLDDAAVQQTLVPLSLGGFVLALLSGLLLFAPAAREYLSNPWFAAKLALIGTAALNALALHLASRRRRDPRHARLAGVLSLGLWATVLLAGRMLAFG
ncbi:hypothetical protein EM868_00535 [Cupriavidus gilardii]|uniref:hypothetical protein n=1 Tax=Cupriavidus gilardii TaxID=82541 RepID=UPI001572CEAA|nr:hypothetical protein [Cupriavidus gilardii]MCG5260441.1 hypothetical protein [Cupriavidus gilardii]MDF9428290.1 hypothetical protein [Cupriavidus gilardii]NSX03234.1 hypothetical protein [Cupriavidus gilardii]